MKDVVILFETSLILRTFLEVIRQAYATNSFCCTSLLIQCVQNLATALKGHFFSEVIMN